jgi:hypothetical protein
MSLDRYANIEKIQSTNLPQTGEFITSKQLSAIDTEIVVPKFTTIGSDVVKLSAETHIYSIEGDYITSVYNKAPILESQPKSPYSILFDIRDIFRQVGINRGSYKIAYNLFSTIAGKPTSPKNYPLYVKEISPDRTEIQISIRDVNYLYVIENLASYAAQLKQTYTLNNLVLNFGSNRINKIVNFRTNINDSTTIFLKLSAPISTEIENLESVWVDYQIIDSYIDTVFLSTQLLDAPVNVLKGPRFDVDIDNYDSQATIYKSWEDLLTSDTPTTQKILDNLLSGSSQAVLNIDYTDWKNFIFYSSAEERLSNFNYKMQLIESYSMDNSTLQQSSGSGSYYVVSNIGTNQTKINSLLESFDSFERWLYYSPTGSIFTHDISGSLTPWPKYEFNNKLLTHSTTSSIVQNWYQSNLYSASLYDETNYNSLWWSLPEHILMDENNSEYQLFIQMIGQHFDNMYMYIKALTQIHERDEHPERGPSNDLLYHIAKSYGWNLQNTRQLSDLWLYKLGTDSTGSLQESPDFRVSAHENQTQQIWRRIVNNLPYLLKTKGTSRSIKALMSIYGIPQSFISIKEYGGPGIDNDLPVLIEDTYAYKLNIQSGSYVKIPQDQINAYIYGWGNGAWCGQTGSGTQALRTPDTYEFRFSTLQSSSYGAYPILIQTSGSSNSVKTALSVVSSLALEGSASISGSYHYGKVLFETFGTTPRYAYSDYLPLFDGDLWTVRIYDTTPLNTGSVNSVVHIARASDSLYGRIAQESIVSMSSDVYKITNNFLGGGSGSFYTFLETNSQTPLSFTSSFFSGSIQAYKEYFTTYDDATFYNHVKNPRAYNVDSLSGSFYSLYRYIPFGVDLQREDHTTLVFASSSQPDQETYTPSLIQYVNFKGSQYTQYTSINETYYSETPQIAGSTLRSEKIRLEDSYLKFELSPQARAENSEYDDKPNDTNRLAIVFSVADQINRDIANHMGNENLDEWISDPEHEFGISYPVLDAKRQEYFQKYQNKYDINSFIRILSAYDYTFFEQIKQLVPGRANLIAGILIEPHMLQRPKVQISKMPEVSNPQWSDTIVYQVSQSGQYLTNFDEISLTGSSEIDFFYQTASIDFGEDLVINRNYITSSLGETVRIKDNEFLTVTTSSFDLKNSFTGSQYQTKTGSVNLKTPFDAAWYDVHSIEFDVIDKYGGFKSGSLQLYVTQSNPNCRYERKIYHYDAYLPSDSYFTSSWFPVTGNAISGSQEPSGSNINKNKLKDYIQFSESIVLKQIFNAVSGSRYLLDLYAMPINTSSIVDLTVKVFETATPANQKLNQTIKIRYGQKNGAEWINRYKFDFISSGSTTIHVSASAHTYLFPDASGLYDYLTPWEEGWIRNENKERRQFIGSTYEEWYYQYNECSKVNNLRFGGCKLEGPGINIDSPNTVDGGPVVEIKQTNPNSIFINGGNSDGNLRIE